MEELHNFQGILCFVVNCNPPKNMIDKCTYLSLFNIHLQFHEVINLNHFRVKKEEMICNIANNVVQPMMMMGPLGRIPVVRVSYLLYQQTDIMLYNP